MKKFVFKQKKSFYNSALYLQQLNKIRKSDSLITNHYIYNESLTKIDLMAKKDCFWNQCFDKSRLKNFVLWFLLNHEEHKTVELVEQLKNLGFKYATKAGISLGIDDLKIPPKKAELILEAEKLTLLTVNEYKRGEITGVERFQRLIDTWHRTSERLKQEVIDNFEATDILNPVYMMAFSGARGNISQVRQLVGMRGLMANPQGQIIDFPIRSNFREGLTLTEYIISSYGARKGIVDTALRTANAGYLTRRLVDVAQHVIISNFDCETRRGIFLTDMKEGNKTIYSLQNRLVGRVLARDIYSLIPDNKVNSKKPVKRPGAQQEKQGMLPESPFLFGKETSSSITIAKRNTEISLDLAFEISKVHKKVFVRSALTCQTKKLVCQLCYGWSLAQGNLVSIGEAVGVVAAQSIGEPGTQLTMRTFHTGGVFSGDVTDQIKAPFDGFVEYDEPIAGTLIRTPEGKIAFLTKNEGSFLIYKKLNSSFLKASPLKTTNILLNKETAVKSKKYKIPPYTLVFKRMGETVFEKEVIAQISSISRQKNSTDDAELTIKSEIEGQFYSKILDLQENKVGPKIKKEEQGFFISSDKYCDSSAQNNLLLGNDVAIDTLYEAWNWGYAWILSGKIYQLSLPSSFFPILGDFINRKTVMNQIKWKFYTEGVGHFLKLHQSLTLPYKMGDQKLINIAKDSSKNKSLISSYFRNKNSGFAQAPPAYSLKSLTLNNLSPVPSSENQIQKSSFPLKKEGSLKVGKNLENILNLPVIKHSLLSFDINKIFYKKSGYLVQLTKQVSLINQSKPLIQPSILSKEDILLLISSLKVPQNGLSTLTDYSINSAPKGSKTYNKELNTFFNFSTSFSSSNWLPNSQFFLNWYPKNSQITSSGLLSIEQGFPTNYAFPFSFLASKLNQGFALSFKGSAERETRFARKPKKTKSKRLNVNPTGLVKVLSLVKEKKYKLQLESAFKGYKSNATRLEAVKEGFGSSRSDKIASKSFALSFKGSAFKKQEKNRFFILKNLDSWSNSANLVDSTKNKYCATALIKKINPKKLNNLKVKNLFKGRKKTELFFNVKKKDLAEPLEAFKTKFENNSIINSNNFLLLNNQLKKGLKKNDSNKKVVSPFYTRGSDSSQSKPTLITSKSKAKPLQKQSFVFSEAAQHPKKAELFSLKAEPLVAFELFSSVIKKEFIKKILKENKSFVFGSETDNQKSKSCSAALIKKNLIVSLYKSDFKQNQIKLRNNKRHLLEQTSIKKNNSSYVTEKLIYSQQDQLIPTTNKLQFSLRWKNSYNYKSGTIKSATSNNNLILLRSLFANPKASPSDFKAIKSKATPLQKQNFVFSEAAQHLKKAEPKFKKEAFVKKSSTFFLPLKNLLKRKEKPLTRVFFIPQYFYQLNPTFSVLLNKNYIFSCNNTNPFFYQINKQGSVKFFYIFPIKKEQNQTTSLNKASLPSVVYSFSLLKALPLKNEVNIKALNDLKQKTNSFDILSPFSAFHIFGKDKKIKPKSESYSKSQLTFPLRRATKLKKDLKNLKAKNSHNSNTIKKVLIKGKEFLFIKTLKNFILKKKHFHFIKIKDYEKNLKSLNTSELKQLYNINQFINFKSQITLVNLKKQKLLTNFKQLKHNIQTIKMQEGLSSSLDLIFASKSFAFSFKDSASKERSKSNLFKGFAFKPMIESADSEIKNITVSSNTAFFKKTNVPCLGAQQNKDCCAAAPINLADQKSFTLKFGGANKKTCFYLCRLFSFSNSDCLTLKSFSKKITYLSILKNKSICSAPFKIKGPKINKKEKSLLKNKLTGSLTNFYSKELEKNLLSNSESLNDHNSIFNFCILPFLSIQTNEIDSFWLYIFGEAKNIKSQTNNKINYSHILSKFIKLELAKSSSLLNCCAPSFFKGPTKKLTNLLRGCAKNIFIKNRTLCSNKDIYKISQNLSFKIKKFNSIKYFYFKSIYNIHFGKDKAKKGLLFSLSLDKTNIKKHLFKNVNIKQDFLKHSQTEMLNKGKSNLVAARLRHLKKKLRHLKKFPIQIKFGWIYVSTNLADNFLSHKKFVFPGQIILDDIIIDSHVSYLEFISLPSQSKAKKNLQNNNINESINHKKVNQVNLTYKHVVKTYFKKSTKGSAFFGSYKQKNLKPFKTKLNAARFFKKAFLNVQDTKINCYAATRVTKNLNSWVWVSNKKSRYLPSYMQFPPKEVGGSVKNSLNFAVLIRKVSEYKQYHLQNYKNDIYHFSNDKFKLLSPLNSKESSLNSTLLSGCAKHFKNPEDFRNFYKKNYFKLKALKLKKELFYKIYLETCFENSSMFKLVNVLINLRSFKNLIKKQPNYVNLNCCAPALIGNRVYLQLFDRKKYSSIQIFTTLNSTKKIFNFRNYYLANFFGPFICQKKSFICKSYSSINLNQEFKNSLQNKQKRTLQTISKFPNIDLELSSNVGLYYARERTTYKSDLSNKDQMSQDLFKGYKRVEPLEDFKNFNKEITSINSIVQGEQKQIGTKNKQYRLKQLFGFSLAQKKSGFNASLPIVCRKAINISPLFISYKIPYGLHGTFNTDFSFFNYKNNVTFHLQKFNNSFYVTKFLQNYILKLVFYKSKKNKMFDSSTVFFLKGQNKTICSEITSLVPAFFNCAYFSYNLIQKLDKTFMSQSDINFSTLNNKVGFFKNNIQKLTLFSKKIEIKNQFFTSKDNTFRSSDCVGKTSSYSSFEGEMIYKKDLTAARFNTNKPGSKNSINYGTNSLKKASKKGAAFFKEPFLESFESSLDSFFPISNENSALILTKQDLISFSFLALNNSHELKNNKKRVKKSFKSLNSEGVLSSTEFKQNKQVKNSCAAAPSNYIEVAKKHYYINDIIIKFQKMNPVEAIQTEKAEINSVIKSVKHNMESVIKINKLSAGLPFQMNKVLLGEFFMYGDKLNNNLAIFNTGQIIHFSKEKITLRRGQPIFISPKAILHKYDGDFVDPKSSVITLAYSQLKTGDIIQGIPKVEQFFEARTTKRGRLFRDSLPNLLKGLFKRYVSKLPLDKAVRQSFYKIQQIIVDGVQRVYRAQGASIADKHLEVIVKQMTSKVRITQGAQTGFFAGEIVDLDFVEQVNTLLMKKIQYEPLVLGITKASLEVESFLSAASFQQTTRVLSKAAMGRKKDFLKGLKENVILGNLIPAGTGYLVYIEK